ncbi:MAG: hypothetical protein PHU80_01245 [Kiritimatiellae bacterium]|nr:hypothetical protein [Kiritimatiellia bacterium]
MAEARLNREYALRIVGVGLLMIGICLWSLYDGIVAWPRANSSTDAVRSALLASDKTAEEWLSRDEDNNTSLQSAFAAADKKAPSKLIKKVGELRAASGSPAPSYAEQTERLQKIFTSPVYTQRELNTQFVQAAVTLCLGLIAFLSIAAKARKRYVADDHGLSGTGIGRTPVAYTDLTSIDWSKWDDKGIVVLRLKTNRCLKLDGWHFAGVSGIVDEIKRQRPDL